MKKLLNLLIIFLFLITTAPSFSQDGDDKSDNKVPKAFIMGEIVVKEKALATVEDASTTTVITDKDIKARGDKTMADALQGVHGVQISSGGKGLARMTLRGFEQERIAFLIDGRPVAADIYDSTVDLSMIGVMNISKIVVNRGAVSALYGSNGALGAVNIITKKPVAMYTQINAEYGQYNNYTLNVAHGSPIGDAYYWLTANMQNSDGYEISSKLTKSEREKWFNKLVRPWVNGGATIDTITARSVHDYLNDTGKWNHTEYTKYQLAGKIGYNITDKMEAGVSVSYYTLERKANTFKNGNFRAYELAASPSWATSFYAFNDANGNTAAFQNRINYWPELYELTVSPYFNGEFGDFSIKANIFYYRQVQEVNQYFSQDYKTYQGGISWGPTSSSIGSQPYNSIWTEESIGTNIFPSYKITYWNKINFAVMYRTDSHTAEQQGIKGVYSETTPLNSLWEVTGGSKYKDRYVAADYLTLAVEDEFKFNEVEFTAGISYDGQKLTDNKRRSSGAFNDIYKTKNDSMIWGTRDSFNPVVSVVWIAIKDFLKFRSALSSKTQFAPLSAYARVAEDADIGFKSERSYNYNGGFETTPLGDMLNIRADYFYSRFKDKIISIYDPNAGISAKSYTNIDGAVSQGVELSISSKHKGIAGIVDISPSLGYTYVHARQNCNIADSSVNKGNKVEDTPEHMITFDLRSDFITGTSLNIFGQHTRNQVRYSMKEDPGAGTTTFSTDYFTAVELHNPFMLNAKLSQKLFENFEVYVLCRNILDDYDADPFNPGPGRMFYFGGSATF